MELPKEEQDKLLTSMKEEEIYYLFTRETIYPHWHRYILVQRIIGINSMLALSSDGKKVVFGLYPQSLPDDDYK